MASNTSSIGVVRDRRDVRRSFSQWKKLTKTLLRAKAAEFGLEQQGNKETLALRIHSHFHPAIPNPPADEPIEEQEIEEPMSPQLSIASTNSIMPPPEAPRPASMVSMSLDDLKALMKDVSSKASRQADINPLPVPQPGTLQLSPASTISHPTLAPIPQPVNAQPAANFATSQPAAEIMPAENQTLPAAASLLHRGNIESLFHSPLSSLPPLSPKLIKAMKAKEYIDLNTLLPNSLYDTTSNQSYSLQVQPGGSGDESVSLTQTRKSVQKITNFVSWMEAWNVFIRAMVHFHPVLAPDLLAYQESFGALCRSYNFQACYRYDIAFRMNVARNEFLLWSRLDEYAFNRFLRCTPQNLQNQSLTCFRCHTSGHFAADCPKSEDLNHQSYENRFFRAQQSPFQPNFRAKQAQLQTPCRHFNNYNNCREPNCRWQHVCARCRGPHPATDCSRAKN